MSAPGIFEQWQPAYAEAGIATFPVREDKAPMTKGYLRTGLRGSGELRRKFPAAAAFGIVCGKQNKITVFDYDAPDERGFRDALDDFGQSPFIVRSASGNFQAYYAHAGEKRMIRPDPARPYDILGYGFVVAAPSRTAKGSYEIIQGGLEDLSKLPRMQSVVISTNETPVTRQVDAKLPGQTVRPAMQEGDGRNDALFRRIIAAAHAAQSLEELMEMAMGINAQFAQPLPDGEVSRSVGSAWNYKEQGRLYRLGGEALAGITTSDADHLWNQPVAMMLLIRLRMAHTHRNGAPFVLAAEIASLLGVSVPTYRAARDVLAERHFIEIVHPGGRGKNDPPLARLL